MYRRTDNPREMHRNDETFEKCYSLLGKGEAILIFPEGFSLLDRALHPIKTGVARIGFGAESRNDFSLGTQIIPMGINYSDPTTFHSDVHCKFGRPIYFRDYESTYKTDPVEAVHRVTDAVRVALKKLTTTLERTEVNDAVEALETIYRKELMVNLGMQLRSKHDEFAVTKGIIDAVHWFYENLPQRFREINGKIQRYLRNLDRLHLRDDFLSPIRSGISFLRRLRAFLFLVLGFPIYLWGVVNNIIPYIIPRFIIKKYVRAPESYSSVKFSAGVTAFVFFYGVQIWLCWFIFQSIPVTLGYTLSLVPAGRFALYYQRKARNYRQHLRFLALFYQRKTIIYDIIQQRMEIIKELNKARKIYTEKITEIQKTSGSSNSPGKHQ
jgi:hypothetical protein